MEQQLRAAQKELDEARSQLASQAQQHGNDMAELENMRTKLDEAQRDLTRERKKVCCLTAGKRGAGH